MAYRIRNAAPAVANQPSEPQIHAYTLRPLTLLVGILLFLSIQVWAQRSRDHEARQLAKAESFFDRREFQKAIPLLLQLVNSNPGLGHAWMLLGESNLEIKDTAQAFYAFEQALHIDSLKYARAWAIVGEIHLNHERYLHAARAFRSALGAPGFRDNERNLLRSRYHISLLRHELASNPFEVELTNAGWPLNTADDEIPNSILLDGSLLLFTRKQSVGEHENRQAAETFLVVNRNADGWSSPLPFVPWQSIEYNMGAPALSPDGNELWFAGCAWPGGLGSCDIYFSKLTGSKWLPPTNAGAFLNSAAWDSQPAISSDGQTLIFASNRPGGYGGSDLYRSIRLPNGEWSKPENLGPQINSAGNEMAPFFHPDAVTLYFSSDGHPGMGSYDLFLTRLDVAGRWTTPVNLGVPINTKEDELNIVTGANGHDAWMAANRKNGNGGYDIYRLTLPEAFRAMPLRIVKIMVSDASSGKPLQAHIRASSTADGKHLFEGLSRDTDGQLLFSLPNNTSFDLYVGCSGYLYFSDSFQTSEQELAIAVKLPPATQGNNLVLNHVYFDFNSATLMPGSLPALRHLLAFLLQNPELSIVISGHTDNVGSPSFNQQLSQQRAEAVKSWLEAQGIARQRIAAIGYGALRPVANNSSEEGRALNRRTEITVMSIRQ